MLESRRDDIYALYHYAALLHHVRHDFTGARQYYEQGMINNSVNWTNSHKALKVSPQHLKSLFGYAYLLHSRKDFESVCLFVVVKFLIVPGTAVLPARIET